MDGAQWIGDRNGSKWCSNGTGLIYIAYGFFPRCYCHCELQQRCFRFDWMYTYVWSVFNWRSFSCPSIGQQRTNWKVLPFTIFFCCPPSTMKSEQKKICQLNWRSSTLKELCFKFIFYNNFLTMIVSMEKDTVLHKPWATS